MQIPYMPSADAVAKIFDRLMDRAKIPVWFVASTLVLLLYVHKINLFGISDFMTSYKLAPPVVFLIWIFSGSCCLYDVACELFKWLKTVVFKRKLSRLAHDKLHYYLTRDQKLILKRLVDSSDRSHFYAKFADTDELVEHGIVWRTEVTQPSGSGTVFYRHIIQPWALKYLQKHPEYLTV